MSAPWHQNMDAWRSPADPVRTNQQQQPRRQRQRQPWQRQQQQRQEQQRQEAGGRRAALDSPHAPLVHPAHGQEDWDDDQHGEQVCTVTKEFHVGFVAKFAGPPGGCGSRGTPKRLARQPGAEPTCSAPAAAPNSHHRCHQE